MNSDQIAFAHPPRSGLRKMSPNTTISNQIQMKNMKNQSIDQKTWPLPKSAITMFHASNGCSVAGAPRSNGVRSG